MTIVITAWDRSPDGGMGLARDTRVRWALEEVGQPYEVRLVGLRAKTEPAHLRLHPFGLIPTYEEGDLALFESGAIVFHIAEHHAGLFPDDADARARAITWMFAAVNTVEPPILDLVTVKFAEGASRVVFGRGQRRGAADPRPRDRQVRGGRQALGRRAPAAGQRSHSRSAGPAFCPLGRCGLARWSVQRGRSHDGVGVAQAETLGPSGRVSDTG